MSESSECSIENCDLDKYGEYEECILHCDKNEMSSMHNPYFTEPEEFYKQLVEYIISWAFKVKEETEQINKDGLRKYLYNELPTILIERYSDFLKEQKIVLSYISFPNRDSREQYDYLTLLRKLGIIWFNYCSFYITYLELDNIECSFQDCNFYERWSLHNYRALQEAKDIEIYNACIFHHNVSGSSTEKEKYTLDSIQFKGCTFNGDIFLQNIYSEKPIFNDWDGFKSKINCLMIHDCNFTDRFVIDSYCIFDVNFKNTVFDGKVEFKNNCTKTFKVNNCNFMKLAEFYNSKFNKFEIFKSIFEEYTGFEKCEFGNDLELTNKEYMTKFTYVTFLNFINFRNTKFKSGVNLEDTNIKEAPNFLNAHIGFDNTSRETFRIIKNSFDKIGNHIEANKFFSLEMKKYKNELSEEAWHDHAEEKIIFGFNNLVSDFGQSYLKPFIWLLSVAFVYALIFCAHEAELFQEGVIMKGLNMYASSILPLKKFLPDQLQFITLSFMFIQSTLIWHIVVAAKRHTKR